MNYSYSRLGLLDLLRVDPLTGVSNFARVRAGLTDRTRKYFADFHANFGASVRELAQCLRDYWRKLQVWDGLVCQADLQFAVLFALKVRFRTDVSTQEVFFFVVLLKSVYSGFLGNVRADERRRQSDRFSPRQLQRDLFGRIGADSELASIYADRPRGPGQSAECLRPAVSRRFELVPSLHNFLRKVAGRDHSRVLRILDFTSFFAFEQFSNKLIAEAQNNYSKQSLGKFVEIKKVLIRALFDLDYHCFLERHKLSLIRKLKSFS